MNWHGNYDAATGTLPISDADILKAEPFDGWARDFADWQTHRQGQGDFSPPHEAWHIRYLAEEMRRAGCWLGRPPVLFSCGCVLDGNHRLRAAQFVGLAELPTPIIYIKPCWKGERCPAISQNLASFAPLAVA